MFCRKCGTQFDNELDACPSCGTPNTAKPKVSKPFPAQPQFETPQTQNKGITFQQNLIFPWIKGSVDIDDTFVNLNVTHTSLGGVIPSGKSNDMIPISKISSCDLTEGVKISRIVFGVILFFAGLINKGLSSALSYSYNPTSSISFLLTTLLAALIIASAFNQQLNIQREGSDDKITIAPNDVSKGRMIQSAIRKAIKDQNSK